MKITVEREPLAEAVAAAGRALSRSPQNPVLAGLLLEAAGSGSTGELTVSGYNYETSVRVRVPATVAEPGRALVSGRLLAAVVKPLGRSPVEIDAGDTAVALCCGTAKFSLPAMRAGDYPTLPAAGVLRGIVPVAALAEAVARVRPAADRGDGGLAQLTAIRLAADGDVLTLSATDRRRAARVTIAWDPVDGSESGGAPFAVLPPARTPTWTRCCPSSRSRPQRPRRTTCARPRPASSPSRTRRRSLRGSPGPTGAGARSTSRARTTPAAATPSHPRSTGRPSPTA